MKDIPTTTPAKGPEAGQGIWDRATAAARALQGPGEERTLTQLRALNLEGMAQAFEQQISLPSSSSLAFEDRVALLVECEAAHRDGRRLTRLLAKARLKYAQACLENLDTRASRGLDARTLSSLAHGQWIEKAQPILIAGPTGVGKTWLACALAQKACRLGHTALYARLPRLLEELRIARKRHLKAVWSLRWRTTRMVSTYPKKVDTYAGSQDGARSQSHPRPSKGRPLPVR